MSAANPAVPTEERSQDAALVWLVVTTLKPYWRPVSLSVLFLVGIAIRPRLNCSGDAGQHDLLDREPVVHALMRIDDANLFAQIEHARLAEAAAEDLDRSARGIAPRGRNGEERRLARAVGTEHRPVLARPHAP